MFDTQFKSRGKGVSDLLVSVLPIAILAFGGATPPTQPVEAIQPASESKTRSEQLARVDPATFGVARQRIEPAIFQVRNVLAKSKNFETGPVGTAFLVSARHRLLATAAHVADFATDSDGLLAFANGCTTGYRVDRVWYHPDLHRRLDVGLILRSDSPRDGEVYPPTADLALLHLAEGGPDLPTECELAADDELKKIDRNPVAVLGIPLASNAPRLAEDHLYATVLSAGLITRLVAYGPWFSVDETIPSENRRWLRVSANVVQGISGGPVFLENGHVIAVAYCDFTLSPDLADVESYRIDAVREMLAYHRLGGYRELASSQVVPPMNPNDEAHIIHQIRKAVSLVRSAKALLKEGRYFEAGRRCNEAIRLVPEYAWAHLVRAQNYIIYNEKYHNTLSDQDAVLLATYAAEDASRCIELISERTPEPEMWQAYANLQLGFFSNDMSIIRRNIEYLGDQIAKPTTSLSDSMKAKLFNLRANCHEVLKDYPAAEQDFDESIRLEPLSPKRYLDRAKYWERRSRHEATARDRAAAERVRGEKDSKPTVGSP
jgi:tetratricopeptide (TPR) repeat protein